MRELGLAKVSRFSNEFRGPGVYRPPDLQGTGTWIEPSAFHSCERKRKTKAEGRDRQTGRQTEAKKQISTVEMSPLGDVAVATCSPRHNARRAMLKEVSLQPLGDRDGVLILMLGIQGHSEHPVILMMILMGCNGGRELSAQTNPSLIKITRTQTHMHECTQQKMAKQKKKFAVRTHYTHNCSPCVLILLKGSTKREKKINEYVISVTSLLHN